MAESGFRPRRTGGPRRRPRRRFDEKAEWVPITKLGRLVKANHIRKLEDIYLFSLPIKEHQIIDHFLGDKLKDEVIRISPVQKQTAAGQRTRFQAIVIVGDNNGHIGIGKKVSKEVATAIRAAIIIAKNSVIPIRRGYWGSKFGNPHTVPCKVTGKCGSVNVRLIPAPKGTGIVAAPIPKKLIQKAGVEDCFTSSCGNTKTRCNFAFATFNALSNTYAFLTPDLWPQTKFTMSPFQEHTDYLMGKKKEESIQRQ